MSLQLGARMTSIDTANAVRKVIRDTLTSHNGFTHGAKMVAIPLTAVRSVQPTREEWETYLETMVCNHTPSASVEWYHGAAFWPLMKDKNGTAMFENRAMLPVPKYRLVFRIGAPFITVQFV